MSIPLDYAAPTPTPTSESSHFCTTCGYDLRGLDASRCPECGEQFDPSDPPVAALPWLMRARLGGWTAFWHTVWLVMLHPGRLADEVGRAVEVDRVAASRFRALCARVAAATVAFVLIVVLLREVGIVTSAAVALSTVPWALLFCWLATTPVDFSGFQFPVQELRFCRLHQFTAAPLALAPILLLPATLAGMVLSDRANAILYPMLTGFALLLVWLFYSLWFQARAGKRGFIWAVSHGIINIVVWGAVGCFCLMAAMATAVFIALLAHSNHF